LTGERAEKKLTITNRIEAYLSKFVNFFALLRSLQFYDFSGNGGTILQDADGKIYSGGKL